jgi:hypothetical protein
MMLSTEAIEELEVLRKKNRKRMLFPHEVVAFAADDETALHKHFEWKDDEAAQRYRLIQAERVIRLAVTIVKHPDKGPMKIRLYCSLPHDRENGGGYRAVVNVLRSNTQRDQLLQSALADLAAFQRKYAALEILEPVMVEIERVLNGTEKAVA